MGGMSKRDIRDDLATWPRTVMKAAKKYIAAHAYHENTSTRPSSALFPTAGGIPFNNWAAWKGLDKVSGVTNWRLHDLRRTWATISADELGIEPHIIEAVLAHAIGSQVSRVYNRPRYIEPMRRALFAF